MNGASPREPDLPLEPPGSYVSRDAYAPQAGSHPRDHRAEPGDAPQASRAAGEDEILRSGRNGNTDRDVGRTDPAGERAQAVGASGERRLTGPNDEVYAGWLPDGGIITGGEVATASLVAEALFAVSLAALAVAERWATLPAPAGGNEILLALCVGLLCGLYALLRLRARRLAWRRQLTGEGP